MRSGVRAAVITGLVAAIFVSLGLAPVYSLASSAAPTLEAMPPAGTETARSLRQSLPVTSPHADELVPAGGMPPKALPNLESMLSQLAVAQAEGGSRRVQQVALAGGVRVEADAVQVVLTAAEGSGNSLRQLVIGAGGRPESATQNLLQATVPVSSLAALSQHSAVRYIRLPYWTVAQAVTEGRGQMGIDGWDALSIRGQGTKIGVIDLGFSNYEYLQGRELPPAVYAKSFRADEDITGTGNDHGTAVGEVINDLAPWSGLYFANFATEVEMANAADWLAEQGVQIIASAVGFPGAGPGTGTGPINTIVRQARERGILWVQAAGNFAQTHWAGLFTDPDGNGFHNFTPFDEGNTLVLPPSPTGGERIYRVEITLTWDDWECWCNDYDLFLIRNDAVVAQSTTWQNGSAPPQERISFVTLSPGRYWISIQRFRSARRANFDLFVNVDYDLEYREPRHSLIIPADSPHALTIGAAALDGSGARTYSSQGPTRDGRIKPDLLAPDGVSTETYGPLGFTGTSASVPHVAAAAALFKSQRPLLTTDQLQAILEARARRLGASAKSPVVGWGSLFLGDPFTGALLPFISKGAAWEQLR